MRVALVVGEDRLPVLHQQHVHVHAAPRLAVDGLGHEGRAHPVLPRGVLDDVFDEDGRVRHLHDVAEERLDLELAAGADFGMVVFDRDAGLLDPQDHLAAALVGGVKRLRDMVVLLQRDDVSAAFRLAVPVRLREVHVGFLPPSLQLPAGLVEQVELEFREDQHRVGDARILHILLRRQHDVPRVLGQRPVVRIVDDHRVAGHGQRRDLAERVDHGRGHIRDEDHIAFLHDRVSVVGGIKSDAVRQIFLRKSRRRDRHVAVRAADVDHLEVDHFNVVFTDKLHDFLYVFEHLCSLLAMSLSCRRK